MNPVSPPLSRYLTALALGLLLSACAAGTKTTSPPLVTRTPVPKPQPSSQAPAAPRAPLPLPQPPASAPRPAAEAPVAQAPAEPSKAQVPSPPPQPRSKPLSLRFEEADLDAVIRTLAELAGIHVVLGPGVKAKVTMWIDRVPSSEAFPILLGVLEVNNLTIVKSGPIYKIVPNAAAAQQPAPIGIGKEDQLSLEQGYLTQIIPLQYLSAEELVRIVQPLVGPGRVLPYRETNSLVLSGSASVIKRLLQMIQTLDVPGKQRDVQQIYVYYVENAKAKELASLLATLFEEKRQERPGERPAPSSAPEAPPPRPPRPGVAAPSPETPPSPTTPTVPSPEGRLVGEVRIVADEAANALIIKATPQDYQVIEETIKKLDITPKQVVIEVLVAEITLTDSFSFGLEQFLKSGDVALQQFFGLGPVPSAIIPGAATNSTGFTLTFVDGDRFILFLNTLAGYTKINTLATPHILTLNNREARIQVGQEVPVVTGTQATITGVPADQAFQTIQQRDIGRILSIRPQVNEKRQVTLDVQLEITDTLPSTTVSGTPSFSKRTVKTSAVVEDAQSLLIGGIISTVRGDTWVGLPWLSKIPILGYLFRTTTESVDRTELFIMLTPHVVANPDEGRSLTDDFRRRLDWVEELLRQRSDSPAPAPASSSVSAPYQPPDERSMK